ncbi:hypothetical protein L8O18_06265 [Enterobacter asburiae]|nr:hypothetical protein [Enterobacter asburiae]
MMSELRAGGFALVFGLKKDTDLNGKSVQLLFKVNPGEIYKSPTTDKLWMYSGDCPSWVCSGSLRPSSIVEYGWGAFHPRNLMPIDGEDFSHEDERQKELTNG